MPAERLKPIVEILPTPPLRRSCAALSSGSPPTRWRRPGAVLRMAMSVAEALLPPRAAAALRASPSRARGARRPPAATLTPARRRVLETCADGAPLSAAEIARRAGCGAGVVRGADRRRARSRTIRVGRVAAAAGARLAAARPAAVGRSGSTRRERLVEQVEAGGFGVTLLDGVTGSGKTETYFAAIAAALAAGRQVLVLLPEIALGAQWLDRFRAALRRARRREWHSDITPAARRDTWRAVADGAGARRRRRALGAVPAVSRARA